MLTYLFQTNAFGILFWVRGNSPDFDLGFIAVGKPKTVEENLWHFTSVPDVCIRVQCSSQTKQLKEETDACAVVVVRSFSVVWLHQGSRFRKIFVTAPSLPGDSCLRYR